MSDTNEVHLEGPDASGLVGRRDLNEVGRCAQAVLVEL